MDVNNLRVAIANLTKTRDLLLPRLISGKLSVEDLDIYSRPACRKTQPPPRVKKIPHMSLALPEAAIASTAEHRQAPVSVQNSVNLRSFVTTCSKYANIEQVYRGTRNKLEVILRDHHANSLAPEELEVPPGYKSRAVDHYPTQGGRVGIRQVNAAPLGAEFLFERS